MGGERNVARILGALEQDDRGLHGTCPMVASGMPTTHASAITGCEASTASTSAGLTFSPPRTMRSTRRSTTVRRPCRSRRPRSPVRTGTSAGTGSASSPRYPEKRDADSMTISPTPVSSWSARVRRTPGSGTPAEPGPVPCLLGGERRRAGRRLRQAVGGDDRPAGPERPGDEVGRDGAAAQQHGAQRRPAAGRRGPRRARGPAAPGRARRGSRPGSCRGAPRGAAAGHARAARGPAPVRGSPATRSRDPRRDRGPGASPSRSRAAARPAMRPRSRPWRGTRARPPSAGRWCRRSGRRRPAPRDRGPARETARPWRWSRRRAGRATARAPRGRRRPRGTSALPGREPPRRRRAGCRSGAATPAASVGPTRATRSPATIPAPARDAATADARASSSAHVRPWPPASSAISPPASRACRARSSSGNQVTPSGTSYQWTTDSSTATPSPPLRGPPGARIRPAFTTSGATSRSSRSRSAVASPWSRSAAGQPGTSGSAAAHARPVASPTPVSNSELITTGTPRSAASIAISPTATGPPTRDGFTTRTSAAPASSTAWAAARDVIASSAAIGDADPIPERRPLGQRSRGERLLHVLQREPGQRPQARCRFLQVPRPVDIQPERDVVTHGRAHGPARAPPASPSCPRVPALSFSVRNPAATASSAASTVGRRRLGRDRGVDADGRRARGPLPSARPHQVEACAVERGAEGAPGDPGPVHERGRRRQPGGDQLIEQGLQDRSVDLLLEHRLAPAHSPVLGSEPQEPRLTHRPTCRPPSGTGRGTGRGPGGLGRTSSRATARHEPAEREAQGEQQREGQREAGRPLEHGVELPGLPEAAHGPQQRSSSSAG